MGHGSLVTYRVQPSSRQSPRASWAAVRAIISACAVASLSVSTWFQPRAITWPSLTTTAPMGTSPLARAFLASFIAWRMNHSSEPGISIIAAFIMNWAKAVWQALFNGCLLYYIQEVGPRTEWDGRECVFALIPGGCWHKYEP